MWDANPIIPVQPQYTLNFWERGGNQDGGNAPSYMEFNAIHSEPVTLPNLSILKKNENVGVRATVDPSESRPEKL